MLSYVISHISTQIDPLPYLFILKKKSYTFLVYACFKMCCWILENLHLTALDITNYFDELTSR